MALRTEHGRYERGSKGITISARTEVAEESFCVTVDSAYSLS